MDTIASLSAEWLQAKEDERQAIERRRRIEDAMTVYLGISETMEGVSTHESDGYKIKVTARMNRKVDGDKLQDIAAEHGLTDHIGSLFRWKPEINMASWKAADESITRPLMGAITTTPSRPSFSITNEE